MMMLKIKMMSLLGNYGASPFHSDHDMETTDGTICDPDIHSV